MDNLQKNLLNDFSKFRNYKAKPNGKANNEMSSNINNTLCLVSRFKTAKEKKVSMYLKIDIVFAFI